MFISVAGRSREFQTFHHEPEGANRDFPLDYPFITPPQPPQPPPVTVRKGPGRGSKSLSYMETPSGQSLPLANSSPCVTPVGPAGGCSLPAQLTPLSGLLDSSHNSILDKGITNATSSENTCRSCQCSSCTADREKVHSKLDALLNIVKVC